MYLLLHDNGALFFIFPNQKIKLSKYTIISYKMMNLTSNLLD